MRVLTAAEMRLVDQRTIELGIPGLILMENAAHRVVECMRERFGPLKQHRIAVYCGKGNNGGDGLAIARLLAVVHNARIDVILAGAPEELSADAAAQHQMLLAADVALGFAHRHVEATAVDVGLELTVPNDRVVLDARDGGRAARHQEGLPCRLHSQDQRLCDR